MAVAKVECPECGKVLKPAKPLTPGKKVRCPKCNAVFTVPGAPEEEAPERQEAIRKAAPAAKKAAPAKPNAASPSEPKKPLLDEDDEGGTYSFVKEPGEEEDEDEEEKKPKINYVPDLEVKDPRGPATLALALPSNLLMLWGALMVVGCLGSLATATWPFMFTEDGTAVTPLEARKKYEKDHPPKDKKQQQGKKSEEADPEVKLEDLKDKPDGGERAVYDELKEDDIIFRIWWAILSVLVLILGAFIAFSSVKMQNLESHRWSMACAIMGMVTIIGAFPGILAMTQLKRDEIKAAFEYVPE
jgi:phage FluMu protein Com